MGFGGRLKNMMHASNIRSGRNGRPVAEAQGLLVGAVVAIAVDGPADVKALACRWVVGWIEEGTVAFGRGGGACFATCVQNLILNFCGRVELCDLICPTAAVAVILAKVVAGVVQITQNPHGSRLDFFRYGGLGLKPPILEDSGV